MVKSIKAKKPKNKKEKKEPKKPSKKKEEKKILSKKDNKNKNKSKKEPVKRVRGLKQKKEKEKIMSKYFQETKPYESIFNNERDSYKKEKIKEKEKEKSEDISLEEKSESISEKEEEEIINTNINKKLKSKTKRNTRAKTSEKKEQLLNKKKSKPSNSKAKKETKSKIRKKKEIKKKENEDEEEIEKSDEEKDESSDSEETKKKSKNKKVKKEQKKNKSKSKEKEKGKEKGKGKGKGKEKKSKKKNIEEININDYEEDNSLTIHNHNIIEDCCLACNEKNIFRAIKTNDKELFNKCLKDINKISSLDYKLQLIGGLTPMEYIIKEKNKKLYTEFVNFNKNPQKQRVLLPKDKLSFLNSGRSNFYTFGFNTRPVGLSRGNKLGNNAFIISSYNEDFSTGYEQIIRKFINYSKDQQTILFHDDEDFINFNTFAKHQELKDHTINSLLNENIDKGNISIVEYLMSVFTSKEVYNYNKLHQLVTVQKPGAENHLDIKNKMSTNKNNILHVTPVHLSCINPNEKILEEVLKNGGETEFQDNMGRKPISYAATCKGPGPLKLLINKKCNVNDRERAGFTPIIHACRTGRYENVKLLLENGADPMLKPRPGQCMAIHFACMKDTENNLKILQLLLDKKPELININGSGKKSPLHFAVLYNCPKIVEFLIRKGAKINQSDKYARSPLLLSCKYGYSQITKYLIECGANIKKCDNSQNSPLHYACAFGNLECVKILLEYGADINYLNMWKNLPIEIALLKNHFGIVKYLINNAKFSVDTHFGNGNTILLYYLLDIDESTFEKIKYIIEEKNGSSKITNSNKMNSFHFLTHFTYRAYLSTFISFNEKQSLREEKHKNVYLPKYIEILKKYINFFKDKGCEPDLENNIGQTPIMLALQNKNFEFAKIFIEIFKKEIDIKHLDNNGFNIFDYAFKDGASLTDECINFIKTMFKIYDNEIDNQFMNQYTRYGRNALLNLCEDYALHIYEKLYFINKKNAVDYIRYETTEKNKLVIPLEYKKDISFKSYKEFKKFISQNFYPLIEEFIKKGCDINCHTEEKKFKNKDKEFEKYKYFNNYGKIYPIMYLISYPQSDELINLIKKYKININCTDLKNQTLLMYLLEVQKQIKNISKNNYQKIFNYLINNCNNISVKNNENKNLFITEFEKGNLEEALQIFNKLGDKLVDINDPCFNNYLTVLGNAIVNSNEEEIKFLLNNFKNININKIDIKYNRNALHYCCLQNSSNQEIDFSTFAKWINLGSSLTQKDIFGRNPLFYLFIKENNEIKKEDPISTLSYLLDSYYEHNKKKKELDLDSVDILGNPLIFYAVKADAVFCVSSLLNKGVKIKNVKNLENNSIFGYALLGNSNSLPELYSKVNNAKVFEDKIYNINKDPIDKVEKEAEKKLKNGDIMNIEENDFGDEINYCVEELFNPSSNTGRDSVRGDRIKTNTQIEKDNNIEKLFEENDEGTSMRVLGNSDNDEFNNYWVKKYDIYSDSLDGNDSYNFPKIDQKDLINKFVSKLNADDADDADDDDYNSYSINYSNKNKLSKVKSDIYKFNYCSNIDSLISNYLNNNYGDHNYHYQNNYIPEEKSEIKIQKYPPINSMKYKLYISSNDNDIKKDNNEEKENDEDKNKLLSESLFKYCIEKNSQNIIYYILNQGYDGFQAISDSLSSAKFKFCVVLLERFNSISTSKLQVKNDKGQTLMHILCNNKSYNENIELISKIYNILTTKINLDINEFDKDMHTPLYYAVLNNNIELINLLTDNMNENKYYLFLQKDNKNTDNISPLMLLYNKIMDNSLNNLIFGKLLEILDSVTKKLKVGYLKNVAKFLIKYYSKVNKDILIDLSGFNIIKILDIYHYLIEDCKIDVNSDIDDKGNNIFFLSAIENNLNLFNNILIKEKNINFNKINDEGKSLIHYIVSPDPLYSYQNSNFLKSAIKAGFNPTIKDKDGLTPLDYARKYKYLDMIKILSKNDKKISKEEVKEEDNMEIEDVEKDNKINFNYNEISDKYYIEKIEPFIQQNTVVEDKSKTLVCKNCGLIVSNYHVYKDDNDCYYNINLSKVDINKYCYGEFLFYHIQLLVNDKKKMYNLITRWGRFGDQGQYQNTPFTDLNEAIKEYNKIFLSKTGNEWDKIKQNLDTFERKTNKYYLLKLTEKKPEIYNIINYFNNELKKINITITKENFEKCEKDMNPNNKELIQYLIKIAFKNKVGNRGYNNYYYNTNTTEEKYNILYFSKESLEKGYQILSELAELNDRSDELKEERQKQKINEKKLEDENSPYNKNIKEYKEISQKVLQLSNSYYEIIPFEDKRNYSVTPINNTQLIKQELDRLQSYTYIEDTLKLFLSSLYYHKIIDPTYYIYKALDKKLIPLNLDLKSKNNKDKKLVEFLLNYIKLTYNSSKKNSFLLYDRPSGKVITNIFQVIDKNDNKLNNNNEKRILLFHGTKTQNMLGILSKGLLIAPVESESSGNRFGSGIYLSDSFQKCLSYAYGGDKIYILLVDVLLDKVFQMTKDNKFTNVKDLKMNGYNCLINDSKKHISFEDRIYFNNGMTIPTKMIEEDRQNTLFNNSFDIDSEYVIYDPKLVNIKFIIELQN